jgi:hypothetical protein
MITGVAQGGPVLARKVAGSDPRSEERMPQAVCSVIAASVERLGRSVPEMDQDTSRRLACNEPMKQGRRALQCEPCRLFVVFFVVSDTSPYLTSDVQRAHPADGER